MKNVLKLIFSSLLVFPFTMNAQQQDFPVGTTPNRRSKCRRSQWQTVLRYGQMGKRY